MGKRKNVVLLQFWCRIYMFVCKVDCIFPPHSHITLSWGSHILMDRWCEKKIEILLANTTYMLTARCSVQLLFLYANLYFYITRTLFRDIHRIALFEIRFYKKFDFEEWFFARNKENELKSIVKFYLGFVCNDLIPF